MYQIWHLTKNTHAKINCSISKSCIGFNRVYQVKSPPKLTNRSLMCAFEEPVVYFTDKPRHRFLFLWFHRVCLLVYIQLYWPADRAHRIQWCPIKNALRLLIELIPKAGPGTINALEKQTELHSESTKASRNQRETSHRSIYTNLMNTLKPAALHLAAGQRLLGVFHSSSEGKKGQKWWELMQNDSWHVWQCNEK